MQYSAHGRKLAYGRSALLWMVGPLFAWMTINIVSYGLAYWFMSQSIERLDAVNYNSRVQGFSKHHCPPTSRFRSVDAFQPLMSQVCAGQSLSLFILVCPEPPYMLLLMQHA